MLYWPRNFPRPWKRLGNCSTGSSCFVRMPLTRWTSPIAGYPSRGLCTSLATKDLLFHLDIVLPEPSSETSENGKDTLIWSLKHRCYLWKQEATYFLVGSFGNYASFSASINLKFCQVMIHSNAASPAIDYFHPYPLLQRNTYPNRTLLHLVPRTLLSFCVICTWPWNNHVLSICGIPHPLWGNAVDCVEEICHIENKLLSS